MQRAAVRRSLRILIAAIRKEDIDSVAKLTRCAGTKVIGPDYEGNTPVHHAVIAGNLKILELLLKNGADVEGVNNAGQRPFDIAVESNKFQCVEMLLKYRARIDIDYFDRAPQDFPKELLRLYYKYVDVEEVSSLGNTALHCTVKQDDLQGVRALISKGADVNRASLYEGYMPLHLAKSAKCVELLLRNGAEANIKDKYACTPLYTTAMREKFSPRNKEKRMEQGRIIKILFENGADGIDVIYAGQIDLDYGRDWDSMSGLRDVLKYMALLEDKHRYVTRMDFGFDDKANELARFYGRCLLEVTGLKEDRLFGTLSLYNFATRNAKYLSDSFCSSRKVLQHFNERKSDYELRFPIYFEILEERFNEAVEWRNLVDRASLSLCNIVHCIDICHIVTQRILDFLGAEDLQSLISACSPDVLQRSLST